MLPREDLLKGVEYRETIALAIDRAEKAIKTWEVVCTDFLSPPEWTEALRVFSRLTDIQVAIKSRYRRPPRF